MIVDEKTGFTILNHENEERIVESFVERNIILNEIKSNFGKCMIKTFPVIKDKEKHTNTFTYLIALEKESYEFIE